MYKQTDLLEIKLQHKLTKAYVQKCDVYVAVF